MKTFLTVSWLFFLLVGARAQECPQSLVINGDLETGSPTSVHNDIDRATGFSAIWNGTSQADYYPAHLGPSNMLFPLPAPASGNYVSCWIANQAGNTSFREGFQSKLTTRIQANSGRYELSFDVACMRANGIAELAVYALYNPNGTQVAAPTGLFTPSNLNLFGPTNTQLIGTLLLDAAACSNTKSRQQFIFDTSDPNFPINGMTHFFITSSDNSALTGSHYTGFDNFCLNKACPERKPGVSAVCLGDINADGHPDYEVTLFTTADQGGNLQISSSCGTATPNSFSLVGATSYTTTITSNDSCLPFTLDYLLYNDRSELCDRGTVSPQLPDCPVFTCVHTLVTNPELEQGTPTNASNTIHLAAGFSGIWASGQHTAEYLRENTAPGQFPPPTPATGDYAAFWVAHDSRLAFREGFMGTLDYPIFAGTGLYTMNFDIACLFGWGLSELAVYGVYNPSGNPTNNGPISSSVPSNVDFFGASNTVLIARMGLPNAGACTNNWSNVQFVIDANASNFPVNGLTHFFITRSDQTGLGGAYYSGFDNFCVESQCNCNTLEDAIDAGVTYSDACEGDVFRPLQLTPCDQVTWYTPSGTILGQTRGSEPLYTPHLNGSNIICINVLRVDPNTGEQCQQDRCWTFTSTSNCGGVGKRTVTRNEEQPERLMVYPNPATDEARVHWDSRKLPNMAHLQVYNSTGIQVRQAQNLKTQDEQHTIDLEGLPEGLYYIQLTGEGYQSQPVKLIKQ